MMNSIRPWQISLVIHLGLFLTFILLSQMQIPSSDEVIEIPIIYQAPEEVQNLAKKEDKPQVVLKSVNTTEQDVAPKNTRQVFGANRDSLSDASDKEGIAVKKGNTLTKEQDNEILKESDAGTLPTPTEEYLGSEMPSVISQVRPVYPKEARDKKIEGPVVIDILIDAAGKVRDAKILQGEMIFRGPALDAIKKFIFRPAQTDGQKVAVRIRYTLNFKLEF